MNRGFLRGLFGKRPEFSGEQVRTIVLAIMSTRERELTCDECEEELERYAELTLSGRNPEVSIPLVQAHLDRCAACREEFDALLLALGDGGPAGR